MGEALTPKVLWYDGARRERHQLRGHLPHPAQSPQTPDLLRPGSGPAGDLETDHRNRQPAPEDYPCSLGVHIDVELRRGRGVAQPHAPAHQDDPLYLLFEMRVLPEEHRDVGERPGRDYGNRFAGGLHSVGYEPDGTAPVRGEGRLGPLGSIQSALAVDVLRRV